MGLEAAVTKTPPNPTPKPESTKSPIFLAERLRGPCQNPDPNPKPPPPLTCSLLTSETYMAITSISFSLFSSRRGSLLKSSVSRPRRLRSWREAGEREQGCGVWSQGCGVSASGFRLSFLRLFVGGPGFEFSVIVIGWWHALLSEWPFSYYYYYHIKSTSTITGIFYLYSRLVRLLILILLVL